MQAFGSSPVELMAADAMLRGEIYCESFVYSALWLAGTATALGAGATVDVQTQINSDSDFVVQQMQLIAYDTADPPVLILNPDMLLMITTAGSGRNILDRAQHVLNVTGSYAGTKYPAALPFPRLMQSNSTITSTLQNRGVATNYVLLSYIGFKVFYTSQVSRVQIFHVM